MQYLLGVKNDIIKNSLLFREQQAVKWSVFFTEMQEYL